MGIRELTMDFSFLEYRWRIGVLGLFTMVSSFVRGLEEVFTGSSEGNLWKHCLIDYRKDY